MRGIRPPIWRRLHVPGAATLGQLHDALQIAIGWTDSRLHQFRVGGDGSLDMEPVNEALRALGALGGACPNPNRNFLATFAFLCALAMPDSLDSSGDQEQPMEFPQLRHL